MNFQLSKVFYFTHSLNAYISNLNLCNPTPFVLLGGGGYCSRVLLHALNNSKDKHFFSNGKHLYKIFLQKFKKNSGLGVLQG